MEVAWPEYARSFGLVLAAIGVEFIAAGVKPLVPAPGLRGGR